MKSKFIFTGLLTTALIFPPVTSNLAHAASPKATETVKDKISDVDDEQETSQDRNHDDNSKERSSEKSDDSKQDKKTKEKRSKHSAHTFEYPSQSSFSSIGNWPTYKKSNDWFSDLFHHSFNNQSDDAQSSHFTNEPHSSDAPSSSDVSLAENTSSDEQSAAQPEERDFFDALNDILKGTHHTTNNQQPSSDSEASRDDHDTSASVDDSVAKDDNNDRSQSDNQNSEQPQMNDSQSSSETDHSSAHDTTSNKEDNQTDAQQSNSEDKQDQEQSSASTSKSKNDDMIDSLLDEYSDNATKTHQNYQKQKHKNSNGHDEQIPELDALKHSREQAPAQTFKDLPQNSHLRQTTLFEQMPSRNDASSSSDTFRVVPTESTRKFINDIAKDAHDIGQKEDIYASIMIAQAILESDSGRSTLSREPNFNLFGMKGSYKGESVGFNTLESDGHSMYQIHADFRKYPDHKSSLNDYADLIKNGIDGNPSIYKGTWKSESSSYRTAVSELVGTYATDPQYDEKLKSLIKTYDLTRFDHKKMGSLLDEDTMNQNSEDVSGDFKPFRATSASPYPQGQCTWYVYLRMAQFDKDIAGDMGNASDWTYSALTKGFSVSSEPEAHTAVVFKPGQLGADRYYGHVAFVEKVNKDGSIVVSESNVKGLGVISYRTIDKEDADSLDYIKGGTSNE